MAIQKQSTTKNFPQIIIGLIFLAISAIMRVLPQGVRDDSGGSYLTIALFLIIGCWCIYIGLYRGDKTPK